MRIHTRCAIVDHDHLSTGLVDYGDRSSRSSHYLLARQIHEMVLGSLIVAVVWSG